MRVETAHAPAPVRSARITPVAVVLLTAAAIAPVPALRALGGIGLALALPGWVLLDDVLGVTPELEAAPLAGAALVLSAATVMLLVVGLAALSVPLTRAPVLTGLDGFVVVGLLTGRVAGRRHSIGRPTRPRRPGSRGWSAAITAAALGAALLAASAASAVADRTPARSAPAPYTALSLVGAGSAIDHPLVVHPGHPVTLEVQLWNGTTRPVTYRLSAELAGSDTTAGTLDLAPGTRVDRSVSIDVPDPPADGSCLSRLTVTASSSSGTESVGVWLRWAGAGGCP